MAGASASAMLAAEHDVSTAFKDPHDATGGDAATAQAEWPQVPVLEPHHFMTEPMESEHHLLALMLFYTLMREQLAGRSDVFVGADLACYFSELEVKNKDFRAPDGIVVLDVPPRERQGWVVWQEGGRYPDLVIEHMSPSTRAVDLGKKLATYRNVWFVREYYAFDLESGELFAFHPREQEGRLAGDRFRSEVLGAWVGVSRERLNGHPGPWLRIFDDAGVVIPTRSEITEIESQRAESERARAESERARAERERARADALEAEVAALRAKLAER